MRIGVLVAFVLSSNLALIPCASAQAEPEAPNRQATSSIASPGPPKNRPLRWQDSRAVTEGGGSMNGPSRGESMSGMMRGPEPKQFYPTLIRIPDPTPVERKRLEGRAQQWIFKGRSQLSHDHVRQSRKPLGHAIGEA